ncbi:hypothetical protein KAR48_16230 [bacterium]|nr:hypothetical protein [bacterium]
MKRFCYVIFVCAIFFTNCKKSIDPDNKKHNQYNNTIALYSDDGAAEDCVVATKNMLEWCGYSVSLIQAEDINNNDITPFLAILLPGGNMYQYSLDISSIGKEKIRTYIKNGGAYIGICGGAYFTGQQVFWQGNVLNMESLGIVPGDTYGPMDNIAPYPEGIMCRIDIDNTHPITASFENIFQIAYWYGPKFILQENANIDILGRYYKGDYPAILAYEYGEGRIFLSGVHPEYEENSQRDGLDIVIDMDDCGSEWDLMKKAIQWCLKTTDEH